MNIPLKMIPLSALTAFPTAAFAASAATPLQTLRSSAVIVALLAALGVLLITAADYGRTRRSLLANPKPRRQRRGASESLGACCPAGAN